MSGAVNMPTDTMPNPVAEVVERLRKLEADLVALTKSKVVTGKFAVGMIDTVVMAKAEIERLSRERDTGVPEAVHVLAAMCSDYMTSDQHHPGYVLVPTAAFDRGRTLVSAAPQPPPSPEVLASSPPVPAVTEQKD